MCIRLILLQQIKKCIYLLKQQQKSIIDKGKLPSKLFFVLYILDKFHNIDKYISKKVDEELARKKDGIFLENISANNLY